MNINYRITLYVPSYRPQYISVVEDELISEYGGVTSYNAIGGFKGNNGRIKEEVCVFEIITTDLHEKWFKTLIQTIKRDLKQESMLYTIEILEEVNFIE